MFKIKKKSKESFKKSRRDNPIRELRVVQQATRRLCHTTHTYGRSARARGADARRGLASRLASRRTPHSPHRFQLSHARTARASSRVGITASRHHRSAERDAHTHHARVAIGCALKCEASMRAARKRRSLALWRAAAVHSLHHAPSHSTPTTAAMCWLHVILMPSEAHACCVLTGTCAAALLARAAPLPVVVTAEGPWRSTVRLSNHSAPLQCAPKRPCSCTPPREILRNSPLPRL